MRNRLGVAAALIGGLAAAICISGGSAVARPRKPAPGSSNRIQCSLTVTMKTETEKAHAASVACAFRSPGAPPVPTTPETSLTLISLHVPCELAFDIKPPGKPSGFHVDVNDKGHGSATYQYQAHDANGSRGEASLNGLQRASGGLAFDFDAQGVLTASGGIDLTGKVGGVDLYPDIDHVLDAKRTPDCNNLDGDRLRQCNKAHCAYKPVRTPIDAVQTIQVTPIPPVMPTPVPGIDAHFSISEAALVAGVTSGKSFTVSGQGSSQVVSGDTTIKTTSMVSISNGEAEYELVLEPMSDDPSNPRKDYVKWQPKGDLKDQDKPGNLVLVRAYLKNKRTGLPQTGITYKAHFKLEGSHQPGVLMNVPAKGQGDEKPDLSFDRQINGPKVEILERDGRGYDLTTKDSQEPALAWVTSYDYGSYGSLSAEITVNGQGAQPARYPAPDGSERPIMRVPEDENENHVADAWEREHGIFDDHRAATWDGELEPRDPASNEFEGDGYTLYEEYRGFRASENGGDPMAIRLDPKNKDFLVYIPAVTPPGEKALFIKGVQLYAKITRLVPHFLSDNVSMEPGPVFKHPWINFQARTDDGVDFGKRQWAISIREADWPVTPQNRSNPCHVTFTATDPKTKQQTQEDGFPLRKLQFTRRIDDNNALNPEAPEDVDTIEVHRGQFALFFQDESDVLSKTDTARCMLGDYTRAWLKGHHLPPSQVVQRIHDHLDELIDKMIVFSVMHELRHAMGGYHHEPKDWMGDPACPMTYWTHDARMKLAFFAGFWDPSQTSWKWETEKPMDWKFDGEDIGSGKGVPKLHK